MFGKERYKYIKKIVCDNLDKVPKPFESDVVLAGISWFVGTAKTDGVEEVMLQEHKAAVLNSRRQNELHYPSLADTVTTREEMHEALLELFRTYEKLGVVVMAVSRSMKDAKLTYRIDGLGAEQCAEIATEELWNDTPRHVAMRIVLRRGRDFRSNEEEIREEAERAIAALNQSQPQK